MCVGGGEVRKELAGLGVEGGGGSIAPFDRKKKHFDDTKTMKQIALIG